MTERSIFECDVIGERFGARNDVHEFELRHRRHGENPFEFYTETVHLCEEALEDIQMVPSRVDYIGVSSAGEIIGALMPVDHTYGDPAMKWYPRDSVVTEHYEAFYQFLEDEVLY